MSRSPFFYVERFNKNTGKYELQHPFIWNWNHTELEPADLLPYNGCHELFAIVEKKGYNAYPEMDGIHFGLPTDSCDEIKKSFEDCGEDIYWGENVHHRTPKAHWFTYADMYIYYLKYPQVPDYEAMNAADFNEIESNPQKQILMNNPITTLKNRIDAFLSVVDDWDWQDDYSLIRIVYWIE